MAPHKYGQYLHILTPAGSDDSHDGPQPWEGITGRVKQETKRVLDVIERSDTAMQSRVDANKEAIEGVEAKLKEATKGVEAKLEAQLGDMQSKLDSQQSKLESKLESIEALLTSLVAEKQ
jgi:vacuolar-type H+-ATPase subunit I/STV1